MLDTLKRLINDLSGSPKPEFLEGDSRLAAAALMFHMSAVDGNVEPEEMAKLEELLSQHYGLAGDETKKLVSTAKEKDAEAVDLYGFTSVLKNKLSEEERIELIEMLWQIVYVDGAVHEFEDNTIWRIAELLGVSTKDRMAMKRKVAAKHQSQ